MALGADYPRQLPVEQLMDLFRIERPPCPVDIGGNTIFLGFRNVVGKAVKLLGPERTLVRGREVEQAGVEDAGVAITRIFQSFPPPLWTLFARSTICIIW